MVRKSILVLLLCLALAAIAGQAFGDITVTPGPAAMKVGSPVTPPPTEAKPGAVKLAYKFTPGELLRYKMVMLMVMTVKIDAPNVSQLPNGGQIPISMQIVMVNRQRTKRILPNGDIEIATAVESMKMVDPQGNSKSVPTAKLPTMGMIIGKNGALKSILGLEKLQQSLPGMNNMPWMNPSGFGEVMGSYVAFPEVAVAVGDAWTSDIPLPMGTSKIHVTSELTGIEERQGQTIANLKQDVTGDVDMKMAFPVPGNKTSSSASVAATGKMGGTSKMDFSINKGQIVSVNGTMGMNMTMKIDSNAANAMSGSVTIDMTMELNTFQLPSGK